MPESEPVALSIVIPMRDESSVLNDLLERLQTVVSGFRGVCEVIAVDDGSCDDTWQRLREAASKRAWLRGLRLSSPFGQHPATFAGLSAARGRVIMTMDADLEVAPEDVTALLAEIDSGSDLVYGARSHPGAGFLRESVGPAVTRFLVGRALGRPPDGISTFLAAKREIVEAALLFESARPVTPYHLMLAAPRDVSCVAVREAVRSAGRSKYGLVRLVRLTADILFGYTSLVAPALLWSALAVLAGTMLAWLVATVLASAGLETLSAFFVLAGVVYAFVTLVLMLLLIGDLVIRVVLRDRPLYLISDSF